MADQPAQLGLQSWAGLRWYPVTILGETPTKYRVRFDDTLTLPSRKVVYPGDIALVPKHAVRLPPAASLKGDDRMSTVPRSDPYAEARAVPLEALLGTIQGTPHPTQHSPHSQYYHTALGKLQITTSTVGAPQLWHFWSGAFAGTGGRGAIDFVIHVGLARDLSEACTVLAPFVRAVVEASPAPTPRSTERSGPPAFRPVPRMFDAAANWQVVRTYLVNQRRLPEPLIHALAHQSHPVVYAGWGQKFGHYLVFPMRHPEAPATLTGAILRWRDTGDPPTAWFDGKKAAKAFASRDDQGWWQVGPYAAPTLVVTESPIDALSLWAALSDADRQVTRIVATGGTSRLTAPDIFAGVQRVFTAQDADAAGETQARHTLEDVAAAGLTVPVARLQPPTGAKDWNDAWQAAPSVVQRCLAQQWHPEADRGRDR